MWTWRDLRPSGRVRRHPHALVLAYLVCVLAALVVRTISTQRGVVKASVTPVMPHTSVPAVAHKRFVSSRRAWLGGGSIFLAVGGLLPMDQASAGGLLDQDQRTLEEIDASRGVVKGDLNSEKAKRTISALQQYRDEASNTLSQVKDGQLVHVPTIVVEDLRTLCGDLAELVGDGQTKTDVQRVARLTISAYYVMQKKEQLAAQMLLMKRADDLAVVEESLSAYTKGLDKLLEFVGIVAPV
eukprot:CAMPEP_0117535988 /NCGR_PEP_ID=MMETSP0784-20121206/41218_1 /TAXON_ID=39447 /ORGANISM="" /LENGTH=240 /DNA_ID=CAMNT_0005332531 /DNA_START=30 /DNA_END=752 /DNA_ORIENTATION=+